jgi:hypothetical protein
VIYTYLSGRVGNKFNVHQISYKSTILPLLPGPAWLVSVGRGRGWGNGEDGEYGTNTVYTHMSVEKWYLLKLFQEWDSGEGMKENSRRVN